MTVVDGFSSPLRRGARFEIPARGWNDLRTLIEGRISPGLEDGRYHSHLVARWRADGGGVAAHRRVIDGGKVTVEAATPATPEQAAHLGAIMVYAAHSGERVVVELLPPDSSNWSYAELSRMCCRWSVDRFGSGSDWPIKPTVDGQGVNVALTGTRSVSRGVRQAAYSLGEAPSVISAAYSDVFDIPREMGETAFADLVGAPDFDTAVTAFKEAEAAVTPYEAAHVALGALIAHNNI